MTIYSGYTSQTPEKLLLDAGAFFKNFTVDSDTYDSAVTAGKLIGASRGGGQFSAIPEIRPLEVDGVKGAAKGLVVIDSWEVLLTANILEITATSLAESLTSSDTDESTSDTYDIITANNSISLADYITNITWVGKLSGSDTPAIIQVYNALNNNGLTLATEDSNEAVIALEFKGHYDTDDLESPPFKIYYPKDDIS